MSKQTIGYRYFIGMHQVFGLSPSASPVTAVKQIKVGEKVAWSGNVTGNTTISINQPDLFGGEEKEGGIVGDIDIEFGGLAQGINTYLAAVLTGMPVPAFRGLLGLVLRRPMVSAMSSYIKPWSIYASRINGGFYPAKAAIGDSMNPAHMIYELLMLPECSINAAPSDINLASFVAVADKLYAEGLGLSFFWEDERPTDEFIGYILEHIDGSLYPNPASGQLTLTLARDDFTLASLPILDRANILRVDGFSQPLPGELTSEVQVKFEDQATGQAASVTVQDIAIMEMQGGGSVPAVRDYQGIPDATLAGKIALRELRTLAAPLARAEITCNRTVSDLSVGGVFRLQWPPLGIADMVMRVAEVDYGTLTSGKIVIVAVQDVFKAADTVIGVPSASGWANPISAPAASPQRLVMEAPYWVVARSADLRTPWEIVAPTTGLLLATGNRARGDSYEYRLNTRTGTVAYADRGAGSFSATAVLDVAVGRTDTAFAIRDGVDLDFVEADTWAHLDGELIKVVSVSSSALVVKRGVLDTVPAPHAANGVIHFADGFSAVDPTEWSSGQTVNAKLLTRTGLGNLLEAAAPADSVVMASRFIRPYPPGNLKVNGLMYPESIDGQADLALTWAHRDRTRQTAYIVEQTEGNIGPEAGQTYTLRIYGEADTLRRTVTGLTGASYTYAAADEIADSGLGRTNGKLRFELESVRDGHVSWQKHNHTVLRYGYGFNYGYYYGGK
jgi:hypothetical protein